MSKTRTITHVNLISNVKEMIINSDITLSDYSIFKENIGIYNIQDNTIKLSDEFLATTKESLEDMRLTNNISILENSNDITKKISVTTGYPVYCNETKQLFHTVIVQIQSKKDNSMEKCLFTLDTLSKENTFEMQVRMLIEEWLTEDNYFTVFLEDYFKALEKELNTRLPFQPYLDIIDYHLVNNKLHWNIDMSRLQQHSDIEFSISKDCLPLTNGSLHFLDVICHQENTIRQEVNSLLEDITKLTKHIIPNTELSRKDIKLGYSNKNQQLYIHPYIIIQTKDTNETMFELVILKGKNHTINFYLHSKTGDLPIQLLYEMESKSQWIEKCQESTIEEVIFDNNILLKEIHYLLDIMQSYYYLI